MLLLGKVSGSQMSIWKCRQELRYLLQGAYLSALSPTDSSFSRILNLWQLFQSTRHRLSLYQDHTRRTLRSCNCWGRWPRLAVRQPRRWNSYLTGCLQRPCTILSMMSWSQSTSSEVCIPCPNAWALKLTRSLVLRQSLHICSSLRWSNARLMTLLRHHPRAIGKECQQWIHPILFRWHIMLLTRRSLNYPLYDLLKFNEDLVPWKQMEAQRIVGLRWLKLTSLLQERHCCFMELHLRWKLRFLPQLPLHCE